MNMMKPKPITKILSKGIDKRPDTKYNIEERTRVVLKTRKGANMYILFDTNEDIHLIDDENELMHELWNLCFAWTNDERYCGDMNYNALFISCLKERDFGDIAQVFKCDKSSSDFLLVEVGETVPLTRIY